MQTQVSWNLYYTLLDIATVNRYRYRTKYKLLCKSDCNFMRDAAETSVFLIIHQRYNIFIL